MIDVQTVSVVFGRTRALDGINLKINEGVTGLFGPNASGKSTLLRALAGLLRPTAGRVTFRDRAISLADEDFRRRVGYVGHEAGLYGRLTVQENLDLFARLHGVPPSRTSEIAHQLGIDERAETPVESLSAGLKRRAAVARALIHDPELLLLDEPYANLDDDASELISSAVKDWRSAGRVAVIATHGAKRVRAFADAGIVLQRGRVVSSRTSFRDPVSR